jgi:hypothetical protein
MFEKSAPDGTDEIQTLFRKVAAGHPDSESLFILGGMNILGKRVSSCAPVSRLPLEAAARELHLGANRGKRPAAGRSLYPPRRRMT